VIDSFVLFRDRNDALPFRIRKWTEERGVDDGEEGGVCAAAERERDDGHGGPDFLLRETAPGDLEVLKPAVDLHRDAPLGPWKVRH
jgi:hypothetical protein